ncbi:beta-ketoacyl-[acyl-carrier-protein] synthase II [Polaromonas eurypsychrophila]|uniref:Beta-ketoacyl-[acyl-carrier-protein] synthase II n=2 Tax=Polaromonas eurypsychrophila TaxID=1614635 RepID=A0A916S9B6_9BURK|nr:beta-ketoacyl-[acyl-carrier-protein] synthase II [Polaromonas eurypsychrophila]
MTLAPPSPTGAMQALLLSHFTATSSIGAGLDATLASLQSERSGLKPCDFDSADLATWIGEVEDVDGQVLRPDLRAFDCRNNRLAQLGLRQDGFEQAVLAAASRYGKRRIGVFLGTSTSGILETELAYRALDPRTGALPATFVYAGSHNPFSVTAFVRGYFGLEGPAMTVSSACSSSAKVFASARRMMAAGLIDAAVVGGVDSLCLTTLYGFNSLDLLSRQPCQPFDAGRKGISIGEGAAFVLLEKLPNSLDAGAVLLRGVGESSDAHHMSAPHPEGLGAISAMRQALASAGLQPGRIDYINLHGTATPSNDTVEGKAVASVFGDHALPCSSTKGATGHTLGAAGGLEAVISALALQQGFMPGGVNTHAVDPALPVDYLLHKRDEAPQHVLSNSFGFGGTNCSLVLGRAR